MTQQGLRLKGLEKFNLWKPFPHSAVVPLKQLQELYLALIYCALEADQGITKRHIDNDSSSVSHHNANSFL